MSNRTSDRPTLPVPGGSDAQLIALGIDPSDARQATLRPTVAALHAHLERMRAAETAYAEQLRALCSPGRRVSR